MFENIFCAPIAFVLPVLDENLCIDKVRRHLSLQKRSLQIEKRRVCVKTTSLWVFVLDFFSLLEKNGEQTFHPTRAHDYQNSLNKIPKLYGTCHILASLLGTDLQMSRSPFLKHYITPFWLHNAFPFQGNRGCDCMLDGGCSLCLCRVTLFEPTHSCQGINARVFLYLLSFPCVHIMCTNVSN